MNPLDRIDGGGSAGTKTNAILDRTEAIAPRPGGGTGLSQGPSGAAIAALKSWLRKYVQDKSGRREILVTIKQKLASTGKAGWYKVTPALWQGKSSASPTCTTSDFSSTQATGTMTLYNLSQMKSSSDSGCNVPPQISPNDPRPFAGLLIGTDAAATQTKTVIANVARIPTMPGVIVTAGPTGQSDFSNTFPQQYWVQQADDASSDSSGTATVGFSGTSNAPIVAVTNLCQLVTGGPRLPSGKPVEVFFAYNSAKVLKPYIDDAEVRGAIFYVTLSSPSGSVSTGYSYTVTNIDGKQLGTAVSPTPVRLFAVGTWNLLAAGQNGMACYNSSGAVKLIWTDETWSLTAC